MKTLKTKLFSTALALGLSASAAFGATIVTSGGFSANSLGANDDGSTGFVNFGLGTLNFFGLNYTGAYLNNNGNMTFGGPLGTFTPFGITAGSSPMLASFFADVDTRGSGSALMTYGTGTYAGRTAFAQTWNGVGYYSGQTNKLNAFQTVLVERSDVAAGDFDIYFNYGQIQWETGGASGGSNGLGGTSAYAGFTNGAGTYYQFAGSGVNGALIDGGPNALISDELNTGINGSYLFTVRSGTVSTASVPDGGSTLAFVGLALAAFAAVRRKRN